MSSQLDLDQGGTFRQNLNVSLGPSIGWVNMPQQSVWTVTTGGTTTILPGTTVVLVSFNGAVTIQLPSAKSSAAGAMAIPGSFVISPVLIFDFGGFAGSNPITILPAATETIDGLASITLSTNYGAFVLRPNRGQGSWNITG